MIDLGMTLAWLAVQVSLVLVPGAVLAALAARRGPAAGASAATLGLGLVLALTAVAFLPRFHREADVAAVGRSETTAPIASPGAPTGPIASTPAGPTALHWPAVGWRIAWDRLGRSAAEPAARCRPWAPGIAAVFVAAAVAGSLRLFIGLVAVASCRRRGRPVDDPAMVGLLDDLRREIGCRSKVDLREVPDLDGPAAAGWLRPSILLPGDWRSWDLADRRAVLAHELAHVVRGDFATGLIARLTLAFHGYHPLAWWLTRQLRLQQELAADAIGARLAGSRAGYLVTLSRLALKQDGRSPYWPARAFLPARGTLIRRITMLRDDKGMMMPERPAARRVRLSMTASLVGLTAAVMTLRGPARAGVEENPMPPFATPARADEPSLPPLFPREGMHGALIVRPSAIARYADVDALVLLALEGESAGGLEDVARKIGVDTKRPDFIKLGVADLEWFACWCAYGHGRPVDGKPTHTVRFGWPTLRTVRPFDWLAFLRQWKFDLVEVREGGGVFYKVTGPVRELFGDSCVYIPDDRTIAFDDENNIRRRIRGEVPPMPAYLRGADWEKARRGLLAVALDNADGKLAKVLDLDGTRPDEAIGLSLLKGIDRCILSVDDADAMAGRAVITPTSVEAGKATARILEDLLGQTRSLWARDAADLKPGEPDADLCLLCNRLITNTHIDLADRSIEVHAEGFGSLRALVKILETGLQLDASRKKTPAAHASH